MRQRWLVSAFLLVHCGPPEPGMGVGDGGMRSQDCNNPCECAERGTPDFSKENTGRPTMTATPEQNAALVRANHWRTAAGLDPLHGNDLIERSSAGHAHYLATNDRTQCWPASSHRQVMGCMNFTGISAGDRLTAQGYRWNVWNEVINWNATPEASIDSWIWTVYHRQPFLNVRFIDAGFARERGPYGSGQAFHNVMEFARLRGTSVSTTGRAPVVFPLPGQRDVPPGFRGDLEGPTPPAPGGATRWPSGVSSGTVVSMHFPSSTFTVDAHEFYVNNSGTCAPLEHTFTSPSTDANLMGDTDVFLYANTALERGKEYVTRIRGSSDGVAFVRTWAFTTAM